MRGRSLWMVLPMMLGCELPSAEDLPWVDRPARPPVVEAHDGEAPSAVQAEEGVVPAVVARPDPQRTAAPPQSAAPEPARHLPALDTLLGFVPSADASYVVLRDAPAVMAWFGASVAGADNLGLFDGDVAANWSSFVEEAEARHIDFAQGLVLVAEPDVVVYATAAGDPDAFASAVEAAGMEGAEDWSECRRLSGDYVVCGKDRSAVSDVGTSSHAAALRAGLELAVPTFDLDEAALVFGGARKREEFAGAVGIEGERMHLALGSSTAFKELPGAAGLQPDGVGLLDVRAPFAWLGLGAEVVAAEVMGGDPSLSLLAGTLSGEHVAGVLRDGSIAALVGVNDPHPAAGLVSMGLLAAAKIEAEVPGGRVSSMPIAVGESEVSTLKLSLAGKRESELVARFGLQPSLNAFSAGRYAGVVFGGTAQSVRDVATYEGRDAAWDVLPVGLGDALRSGDTLGGMYLPLDALGSVEGQEMFRVAFAEAGGLKGVGGESLDALLHAIFGVSSLAIWARAPGDVAVLHIEIVLFGDPMTEQGQAAVEALQQVRDGSDPQDVFGALAERFPGSPLALRARVRAGTEGAARRGSSALVLGALAGALAPGFLEGYKRTRGKRRRSRVRGGRRRSRTARAESSTSRRPQLPRSEARANGIYTPGPDPRALEDARGARVWHRALVGYCVRNTGKVDHTEMLRGSGVGLVDSVLRRTVSKWRFKPLVRRGKARGFCSSASFDPPRW